MIKTVISFIFIGLLGVPQSANMLRSKYGKPVAEVFMVRPGILATIKYDKNGEICSEQINAQESEEFVKENITKVNNDVLRAIVEELVPRAERGRLLSSGFVHLTCVRCESYYGGYEDYEKVKIKIGGPTNEKQTAEIEWVGKSCPR